jgi:hypothetical protein
LLGVPGNKEKQGCDKGVLRNLQVSQECLCDDCACGLVYHASRYVTLVFVSGGGVIWWYDVIVDVML